MAIDAEPHVNPYLTGHYEPVPDERIDRNLEIIGDLPAGLAGTYMRNGANPAFTPPGRYHIFDGDGMIHAVTFDGEGGAHYRNRFVESKGLIAERRLGKAVFGGLSEFSLPPDDLASEVGLFKNTANTNIVRHADRILALMEAGHPTELSADLGTIGEYTFGGRLQGPMTAHPRLDASTGEMCFFGYLPFPPFLRFHVVSPSGDLVRSVDVDAGRATMMHDFVITDRNVIFFDLPALFDLDRMLSGGPGIYWDGAAGARIGVLPRDGGSDDVTWIETDPFYVFHFMNAKELADGRIEVIGCRSNQLNVSFDPAVKPPEGTSPKMTRWTIDVVAGTVTTEALDDRSADFPRIDDRRSGLDYRYGYVGHTSRFDNDEVVFDGVTKWDWSNNTDVTHVYASGTMAGEAVFAPDPSSTDEDAGWLLNFVTDGATMTTSLIILDAQRMEQVCEVKIPRRVPFGFHGNWMAGLLP